MIHTVVLLLAMLAHQCHLSQGQGTRTYLWYPINNLYFDLVCSAAGINANPPLELATSEEECLDGPQPPSRGMRYDFYTKHNGSKVKDTIVE